MSFHVSAIQLAFSYASTPQQFFDRVREPIERAVAATGAQLIALPNYTGLQLLGIAVPAADDALSLDEIARAGEFPTVAAMLREIAPTMRDFFVNLFASLAQRLRLYLAPGTVIEGDGGRLYNTAYLFAPDGTLVGAQRQTHRTRQEIAWGLSQGDELRVFDIGSARVGFVVGTDVEYPEVSRILALQGANVLIHPAAYATWNAEHFLIDLWREVQSNQVFGVQACRVGENFRGRSAIYVPVEMTPTHQGILVQTPSSTTEGSVSAVLDFDALQKVIDGYPIFDFFNYEFCARELPKAYRLVNKTEHAIRNT